LILVPIVLDTFLWLGPRLSPGQVTSRFVEGLIRIMGATRPFPAQDVQAMTEFAELSGRFNWLSWIRTFPVGVSSLEAYSYPGELPLETPFGIQTVVQISSFVSLLGSTVLLVVAGWIAGGLYFRWVSVTALGEEEAGISPMRAIVQTFLLSLGWTIAASIVLVPFVFILALITQISPLLGNTIVIVILILSYWLIVPLFFMPHGIFARKQNALFSVLSSLRMSRFTLPTSGMFVFSVFLLARGLSYLWSVPESDSWMTLVGISGHAFITTTLLAASLVYYRDMNSWIQQALERLQQKPSTPSQQA
jgi:hypothetical protein